MPDDRFFVPENFATKATTFLKDQELHHLLHVMRVRVGESIELVNGKGQLAYGILEKIEKQQAHIAIQKVVSEEPPSHTLILAQGLPRLPRLEYILEKATELGVTDIWLFPADQSERKELTPTQLQRLQQILISSIKQCGRLYLPKITLKPALYGWQPLQDAFFGDTTPTAPPLIYAYQRQASSSIWIVGPEKGFTKEETSFLTTSLRAQGVSLHPNTLRVDTAAIAGLSLLSSLTLFPEPANN